MLQFEGDQDFGRPPALVFAKLGDASFLVSCVPGVESVKEAGPDQAVCVLRPGFSFVRGTLEVTLQVLERVPEKSIRVLAHAKGIGSGNDVEALLKLEPKDAGTHIHWTAEAKNFTGLLRAVPAGLMQGAAQKVIADVWVEVGKKLD
jgi:carbon monoxide dehydrogenase subunit G